MKWKKIHIVASSSRFIANNYGIITDILMNNLVENNTNNRTTLKIIDMLGNEMA